MQIGKKTERGKNRWGEGEQETKNRTFRRRRWGGKRKDSHKRSDGCRRGMRRAAVIDGESALEKKPWKPSPRILGLRTIFLSKNTLKLQTVCIILLLWLFCVEDKGLFIVIICFIRQVVERSCPSLSSE